MEKTLRLFAVAALTAACAALTPAAAQEPVADGATSADNVNAAEASAPASTTITTNPATADSAAAAPADAAAATATVPTIALPQQEPPKAAETDSTQDASAGSQRLDSVEITASYRKENIQDVTGSAQAFSGRSLDDQGVTGMQDYLRQVPSVSLQKSGNGKNNIAMRGISNVNASDLGYGAGSPTVGVYLNDVGIQGSGVFPDLNIYDLQRIEVLKGPQGTLYGEGSMGGAIKMVTNPADPDSWLARAETSYSLTEGGAPSKDARAMINIPLISQKLGAKLVGSIRHTGGFVDYTDPAVNQDDANDEHAKSLRAVLDYKPLDWLDFEYMVLYDADHLDQFAVVDPGAQDQMTNENPEHQYSDTRFSINALTAHAALSFANLTSVTALYHTAKDSVRRAPVLQNLIDGQLIKTGLTAPVLFKDSPTHVVTDLNSVSEELRLVSFGGETVDWIAGAFYRQRGQKFYEQKYENTIPDDPTGILSALLGGFNPVQGKQEDGLGDERFHQIAVYGEATWNVMPSKWDITGGLRVFKEDISFLIDTQFFGVEAFLLATDPSNIEPGLEVKKVFSQTIGTQGLLPKLSTSWHFDEDHMVYASVTRGFRSGTPNPYTVLGSGPPVVKPDYVLNTEIGSKSTWLDGRLITNLALYHIDWTDLQATILGTAHLGIAPVQFAHLDNAGDAVVWGGEFSTSWMPAQGLVTMIGAGINHGHITKPQEGSQLVAGQKLPNSPELTASATLNYTHPLWFGVIGDFNTTYTWTGEQIPTFAPPGIVIPMIPSYSLLKAGFGGTLGSLRVQLYGDNLLNKHAVTAISGPIAQYAIVPPRVVGLRVGYEF